MDISIVGYEPKFVDLMTGKIFLLVYAKDTNWFDKMNIQILRPP